MNTKFIDLHNTYFPKNNIREKNPKRFKVGNINLGILVSCSYTGSKEELLFASEYNNPYQYCVIKKNNGGLTILDITKTGLTSLADVLEDNVVDEFIEI